MRDLTKWIIILLIIFIGIPLIFVKGVQFPWIKQEIPIINVWNEANQELMVMTLEEYVKGVVAAEMPISFELEALMAQAVVARTYALQRIENDQRIAEHPQAHLSTDYRSGQAWVSLADLKERWGFLDSWINRRKIDQAVESTSGVIATYDGKPILAVYHSTSGGRTENSENYWVDAVPYLRSVDDPFSSHSPYQYTLISVTKDEILQKMELSDIGQIKVIERYPSGRVKAVEAGGLWFSGRDVRERLGLRSTWFTVTANQQTIDFSVWGYGHGVGMSQYGADGMAREGYDYQKILQYYYQGITLEKLY